MREVIDKIGENCDSHYLPRVYSLLLSLKKRIYKEQSLPQHRLNK